MNPENALKSGPAGSRRHAARPRARAFWPGVLPALVAALVVGLVAARLPLPALLLLTGGTAVAILTYIRPLFGLGLTLILAPLGALETILLGSGPFDSGQALLLLTLGAWISRKLVDRRLTFPHLPLTLPLLLFSGVMLLTLPGAADIVLGLTEVLKWLEITAVMLLVADLGREKTADGFTRWRTGTIAALLLLAGTSQALIGIWQFGLRGDGPEHFLILERFYRAAGTFEQPNPFGGYMNLTALLAGGLLIGLLSAAWQLRRAGKKPVWGDWLRFTAVLLVFLLTSLALLFSWSRGAWLGFAAGTAVLIAFWPRRLTWVPLLVLALLLVLVMAYSAGLVPAALSERLAGFAADFRLGDVRGVDINDANYAVLERLAHWQSALAMARENLWLGVGFGNYGAVYAAYDLLNWPDALGHAHNYYLNLLAETGMIGLLAYALLWLAIIWRTLYVLRRAEWPARGLALGLLAVWTAVAVHHLVDKLYVNNIYIHLGVLLGLLELLGLQVDGAVRISKNTAEEMV